LRLVLVTGLALVVVAPNATAAKRGPGKVIARTATAPVPAGATVTVTATCPKGRNLVGGGFESIPADLETGAYVFESRRTRKRSWRIRALRDPGVPGASSIKSYAYCRRGAPRLGQRNASATLPTAAPLARGEAIAICPGGRKAVAGGFAAEATSTFGTILIGSSKRTSPRDWTVSGAHTQGVPLTLTAYAYCAGLRRFPRSVFTPVSGDSTRTVDTFACLKGTRALSGGFALSEAIFGDGTDITTVFESRRLGGPLGRRWRTTAEHTGATTTGTAAGLTYCGP